MFSEACVVLLLDLRYNIFVFFHYQIKVCLKEPPGQNQIDEQIYLGNMVLTKDHHQVLQEAMKSVCRLTA